MRAASIVSPRQVEFVDIREPTLGPEDVLIKVHYVGLCGSDLNTYRGSFQLVTYPRVPGHEISGAVLAKGDRVPDSVNEGDKVTLSPYTECGICSACRARRFNCCRLNQTLGLQREGAMASRFAIHYSKIFSSSKLSTRELVLVEPLSVGYHAVNRGRVTGTDTVLVIGSGTIGTGVIMAAARKGATVIAADIDDGKLADAGKSGADHTVNSGREDVLAAIQELTSGEGASIAIEAVGLPDTYRLAVEAVAYAGRVVYVGYAKDQVCYDTTSFVRKELDILGSRNALGVFPAVIKMLEDHSRPFTHIISRVYPFCATEQAFHDWSDSPTRFTKILIDLVDVG